MLENGQIPNPNVVRVASRRYGVPSCRGKSAGAAKRPYSNRPLKRSIG
jgi:hypothetical protein